jgi:hypothetical protein
LEGWRACRFPSPVMAIDDNRVDCVSVVKINLRL